MNVGFQCRESDTGSMRLFRRRHSFSVFIWQSRWALLLSGLFFGTSPGRVVAQTPIDAFHWISFHDPKDAAIVQWVTNSLQAESWSEIREIGVQWDAALVITSERKSPQSAPPSDIYTVWNVSLSKHEAQPLFHATNPRILNWTSFGGTNLPELGLIYDDCADCQAPSMFFTAAYYNIRDHVWRARWVRGDKTALLWSGGAVEGVNHTQVYGILTEPSGRQVLGTWSHFDYGKTKPAEDFLYIYSVDAASGLDLTQALAEKHGDEMKQRLCRANPGQADPDLAPLARGQDSEMCRQLMGGKPEIRTGRRPVTTPPPNNHGKSTPPGTKP